MYCKRCGSKLEDNTLGCPVCGQAIDEDIYTDIDDDDRFELGEHHIPNDDFDFEKKPTSNDNSQIKEEKIKDKKESTTQETVTEAASEITGKIPKISANGINASETIPAKNDQGVRQESEAEISDILQAQQNASQLSALQKQTQQILYMKNPAHQGLLSAHRGLFFTFIALIIIAIFASAAALYIFKDQVEQASIPNYTISYETNGGSRIASQVVKDGTIVSAPPDPTISGRYFAGWFSDASCQTQVKFPLTITSDMTLYAKWLRDQKSAQQSLENGSSNGDAANSGNENASGGNNSSSGGSNDSSSNSNNNSGGNN